MKLFAKGHLIFLLISFICSSQTQAFRLCPEGFAFFLWVASVPQSRLRRFIEVCPRAGKFINVCYRVGDAAPRPSASGGFAAFKQEPGGSPLLTDNRAVELSRPSFSNRNKREVEMPNTALHTKATLATDPGCCGNRSRNDVNICSNSIFPQKKLPILDLCLIPVAYQSCSPSIRSRSSFSGRLCVFCAKICPFLSSPLRLNAVSFFKPPHCLLFFRGHL